MNRRLWLALAMVCLAGLAFAAPAKRSKGGQAALPGQAEFVQKALTESLTTPGEVNPEWVKQVRASEYFAYLSPQYRALIQANAQHYVPIQDFCNKFPQLDKRFTRSRQGFMNDETLVLYAGKRFVLLLYPSGKFVPIMLELTPEMLLAVFEPVKKPTIGFTLSPKLIRSLNAEEKAYAKMLLEVLNENFSYIYDIPFLKLDRERYQRNEYAWRVYPMKALLRDAREADRDGVQMKVPETLLHPQKGALQRRFGVPVYDWSAVIGEIGEVQAWGVQVDYGINTVPSYRCIGSSGASGLVYGPQKNYLRGVSPPTLLKEQNPEDPLDDWRAEVASSTENLLETLQDSLQAESEALKALNQWTPKKQQVIEECLQCLEKTLTMTREKVEAFWAQIEKSPANQWMPFYCAANPHGSPKKNVVRSCVGAPPSTEGNFLKRSPQPLYKKQ